MKSTINLIIIIKALNKNYIKLNLYFKFNYILIYIKISFRVEVRILYLYLGIKINRLKGDKEESKHPLILIIKRGANN